MTDVEGLVEFLTARLDQAESEVRFMASQVDLEDMPAELVGTLHDPRVVLADIAAKRRLIGLHLSVEDRSWQSGEPNGWLWCRTCGTTDDHPIAWPCETLKLLGLPFSGHRDYRQEWTP